MNLMEKYRARLNDARQGKYDLTALPSGLTEDERFIFEERAAIMEYEGSLTRGEAERQAREALKAVSP